MKCALSAVALVLWLFAAGAPANAEVLGRRQIGIGVGLTWVGDNPVDGTSLDFGARIRLPLGRNVDIVAGHSQSMREGYDHSVREAPYVKIKGTEYGVGLIGHFLPRQAADPYLEAGVSNVTTSTTHDGRPTYADEDVKYRFGAGLELNIHRNISVILAAAFQDSFRDSYGSDLSAGISAYGWITEILLVGAGLDGSLDSGDVSVSVKVAYGF